MRVAIAALLLLVLGCGDAAARLIRPQAELLQRARAKRAPFPYAVLDRLLARAVDGDGRVDYAALRAEGQGEIEALYAAVAARRPDAPGTLLRRGPVRDEALAFYLNAYNLLVLKAVLDAPPGRRDAAGARPVAEDLLTFYSFTRYLVAGEAVSLEELRRKVIMALFSEPAVHFALACGACGCPRLRAEAYWPERVGTQLQQQARRFLGDPANVHYDPKAQRLRLSPLLSWYADDFGPDDTALLAYLNRHRGEGERLPPPSPSSKPSWIEHRDPDWRLCER